MKITTIGLDLSKSVFQVHGVDEDGVPVLMKRLRRKQMEPFFAKLPSCLIGIEACATAHHWARVLVGFGHEVKLMPPAYVKAYVKRGKNDAADAEAICEAIRRPTMRFVPIKSPDQQSILMIHRARSLVVRQRTMAANALRSHLAEFGRVANPGIRNILKLARSVFDETEEDRKLPELARTALAVLVRRLIELEEERQTLDQALLAWHKETEASRKLATVPGIGVVTATAIAATVSDPQQFRSGRQFAAWLGLVPQQHSSGSKVRLGGISKQGDRYLRRMLVIGATAIIRHCRDKNTPMAAWLRELLAKKPVRVVSVALANKLARVAWALLTRQETYQPYRLAHA
ncbi:MAG: IS110 family transposase [Hyphomicrobiales bacterium]|nr:IS110 family transposase [Hyphomicrobiales bacterium]